MANKVKISEEQMNTIMSVLSKSFDLCYICTDNFKWNEKDENYTYTTQLNMGIFSSVFTNVTIIITSRLHPVTNEVCSRIELDWNYISGGRNGAEICIVVFENINSTKIKLVTNS